jgi:phospholipid transport system substrate-binding protein
MTYRKIPTLPKALCIAACLALAWAPFARADERVDSAVATVQATANDALAILGDKSLDRDARIKKLEAVAGERFDFPRMSQLVLGRNRSQLSAEQQQQFTEEFKKHLSLTYGRQIDKYTSNEKITVGAGRLESNGDVTVKTHIEGGSAGTGINIDYRLREDAGKWLAIDVIPENVSLLQNFRSQVQDIVTQQGASHLVQALQEKNAEAREHPVPPPTAKN